MFRRLVEGLCTNVIESRPMGDRSSQVVPRENPGSWDQWSSDAQQVRAASHAHFLGYEGPPRFDSYLSDLPTHYVVNLGESGGGPLSTS